MKDKLVAVDTYSALYFGLEDLPTFDMMEPDTEQIAVLEPDLMFTTGMSVKLNKTKIKPGEQAKLKVTLNKKQLRNARSKPRVLIITNDPKQPKVVVKMKLKTR